MKNPLLRKAHACCSSLLIFILHLPFVFANTKPSVQHSGINNVIVKTGNDPKTDPGIVTAAIYDSLQLSNLGLSEQAFRYAVKGYNYLDEKGKISNEHIISIVDFSKPSNEKRLFVIDMQHCKILFNTYVAHGQGSGKEFANRFSNNPESLQSSLGFFLTSDTYTGKNGYSLHLSGMEKGINDKADKRAIVMHGASYVSETYIRSQGCIGRSWGCPAVPEKLNKPIIEKIKNGSCLFIYGNNKKYFRHSKILNS